MTSMLGMTDLNTDDLTGKLEETLPIIRQINKQFKDPVSVVVFLINHLNS